MTKSKKNQWGILTDKQKKDLIKEIENGKFLLIYNAAFNNAIELVNDAKVLYNTKRFPRAYFLAFTALEEISKSQAAADVFTGLNKKEEFWKIYTKHKLKIKNIKWATIDANELIHSNIDDKENIDKISEPQIEKRMNALYVHLNNQDNIMSPSDNIQKKDARDMIHIADTAIYQIKLQTEFWGHQIGTKGFMK